jgi:hypothetical protein
MIEIEKNEIAVHVQVHVNVHVNEIALWVSRRG